MYMVGKVFDITADFGMMAGCEGLIVHAFNASQGDILQLNRQPIGRNYHWILFWC